jgi:hypothetical protein
LTSARLLLQFLPSIIALPLRLPYQALVGACVVVLLLLELVQLSQRESQELRFGGSSVPRLLTLLRESQLMHLGIGRDLALSLTTGRVA